METLRKEGKYSLNKGYNQASGLFNITSESGGVSLWFDEEEKEHLLGLSDYDFLLYAIENVEENEPKIHTESDMKEFGLWLGNNLKKFKGKTIDDLYLEFVNQ
jgi:hypothetical protein